VSSGDQGPRGARAEAFASKAFAHNQERAGNVIALGKLRRFLPWLVSRIVDSRLRFESKQSGKVVVGRDVKGLEHVLFSGKNAVGHGSFFAGDVKVGYGTTIGANSHIQGPVNIGNYCQIGPAVGIYGRDHPTSGVTTYFNQSLFQGRLKQHEVIAEVQIGHDVWLGHGVVLLKGAKVGNGAVIGAGAIVTKEIPDYAVAAGTPARVIRMRFDKELIKLLSDTAWWLKTVEELAPFEEVFHIDLVAERDRGALMLQRMVEATSIHAERNV
jgi:acetyltransferase-like isoleucine patch superfamily enzyme